MKITPHSSLLKMALFSAVVTTSALPALAARDRFDFEPKPAPVAPAKPKSPSKNPSTKPVAGTLLAVGEIREVFDSASAPDMVFFIPASQATIVQVIVEKKFLKKPVYFVKGIRPGTVSGGLVPKAYLDKTGFKANNVLDEARAKAAIQRQPYTFTVR